jgi:1,4-dihydroxy-2-naphthoate octaprenyltransferase
VISAFTYSGGPWPYGYHGLGEVFVFVFFGLVAVAGTTYLQTLSWEPLAFASAIGVGSLITAILVINNLRDITTDERTGKRTLAVILGERGAMAEYDLLLGLAFVVPVALVIAGDVGPTALLPLASLPLAPALYRLVHAGGDPRRLNPVLRETARLSLVYCILLAVGLAVPGIA